MSDLVFFIALGVSVLSAVAAIAIAMGAGKGGVRRMRRRIDKVRHGGGGKAKTPSVRASVRREDKGGIAALEAFAKKVMPRQELLRERLDRTGKRIPLGSYAAANVVLFAVAFFVVHGLAGMSGLISLAAGVVVGIGLPHWLVGFLAARRANKFNEIFPDAVDLIVRGLRSGLPVSESINAVSREMADPVGAEFRGVVDAVRFGRPLEDALWSVSKRLNIPEFKFFVISLSVQKDTGGNLAETLGNLSDILRKRRQMKLKIRAMSSEAKASAMILGGLPFLMFAVIYMMTPGYEAVLFTDPRGKAMLIAGLGIMAVGIVVMRNMVRFEI